MVVESVGKPVFITIEIIGFNSNLQIKN